MQGDDQFWHHFRPLCRPINFMKGVWAFGWAGALGALFYSKDLIGIELFGTPIWFIAVGIRLACLLIDEGIFSACGCSRTNKVRRFFMQMERIYLVSHDGGKDAVLGWKYMRQPVSRVWRYTREYTRGLRLAMRRCEGGGGSDGILLSTKHGVGRTLMPQRSLSSSWLA